MKARGNKPWELTFMDPRLEGDDFVGKDDYLKSMHPKFKNPVDNQFANLEEEGKDNEDLVFGDNEGASPSGEHALADGKDDPAGAPPIVAGLSLGMIAAPLHSFQNLFAAHPDRLRRARACQLTPWDGRHK